MSRGLSWQMQQTLVLLLKGARPIAFMHYGCWYDWPDGSHNHFRGWASNARRMLKAMENRGLVASRMERMTTETRCNSWSTTAQDHRVWFLTAEGARQARQIECRGARRGRPRTPSIICLGWEVWQGMRLMFLMSEIFTLTRRPS